MRLGSQRLVGRVTVESVSSLQFPRQLHVVAPRRCFTSAVDH